MATYRSKAKPKNYDRHIIMSKGHRYVEMSESDDGNPSTPRYRGNRDYRHQNNEMEFEGGLKKVVQPKKKTQPKQKTQPLHNTRSHDAVVPPQNGRRSGGGGPQSANVVPTAPQPSSRGVKKKRKRQESKLFHVCNKVLIKSVDLCSTSPDLITNSIIFYIDLVLALTKYVLFIFFVTDPYKTLMSSHLFTLCSYYF